MTEALPRVEILSKPDCHLCEDAKALLHELQTVTAFILTEIDITTDAALLAQYGEEIPVIFINGRKAGKYRLDPQQFLRRLHRPSPYPPQTWWQRWRQRRYESKGNCA